MATSNDSTQYVGNYSTTAASNVPPDSGATGKRYQGAAEIRQIKKVLKDSFPSVTGAVTATHTEINQLDGITLDQSVDTTATPDFVGVTAGYFRADQGAPNSADASTNGYAFGSDGDTGMFAIGSGASSTGLGLYTNNSQRMYVQASNGYVGIATDTPSQTLEVNGTTFLNGGVLIGEYGGGEGGQIEFYDDTGDTTNGGLLDVDSSENFRLLSRGTGDLLLGANSAEAMRVTATLNVGIGETSPDYKLDVNGSFGFTPGSSVTPADNGDVVFELTNNTTLTIKAKGSDGTVRTATVTLA